MATPGPRRWLPQTFRVRLTLLFAVLFLTVGAGLLGITYGLVASLPVKVPRPTHAQAKLALACKLGKAGLGRPSAHKRSRSWAPKRRPATSGPRHSGIYWPTPWWPWAP